MQRLLPETFPTPKKDRRRGSALLLAALFCLVLIPMIGLAVDGTNVYMMRNQIVAALDAAVLAGCRSLSLGSNITAQEASATTVATNTFTANISGMPSNMPPPVPSFTVTQDPTTKIITVAGSVTATLPLMLMEIIPSIGLPSFTVSAKSSRRSVNIMMVLDHSGPMFGAPLAELQADAITFLNTFVNGTDDIGLVTYTAAPFVADPLPNLNFQSNVPGNVSMMQAPGVSASGPAAALSAAYQQIQNVGQPGALNVIVLFTAGITNAFSGNFAPYLTSTTPCNPSSPGAALNGGIFVTGTPVRGGGTPYALSDPNSQGVTDNPDARAAPGCNTQFATPSASLTGMPAVDIYGNSANGTGSIGEYAPVNLNSIDFFDIVYASENALDDAANKIRGNAGLPATIFVIGLGDATGTFPPDPVLMPRIANDPSSPSYNSSQPAGQYILAPTAAQLQSAFAGIASQVLKLATQ